MVHPEVVGFVVVDSHIQRIVLATEESTVTQLVSHRPIKCQSRLSVVRLPIPGKQTRMVWGQRI